ncbi:MAG: NAD(P)-dependent oxidoreductase [Alphaproteobacteria bacterium]|nr:NAD(P)-dependent oxidoreductase [Alphaproteobacteria bacterium]
MRDAQTFAVVFVGLGNMGLPMASNLMTHGHRLVGVDLDPAKQAAAQQVGITATDSIDAAIAEISQAPAGDPLQAPAGDPLQAPAGDPRKSKVGDPRQAKAGDPQQLVVMTSLPGPREVEGMKDLLDGLPAQGVWIDLSTCRQDTGVRLGEWARAKQCAFIDAPITGGAEGAKAGTLIVMAAGDEAAVRQIQPLLDAIGSKTYFLGANGAGYVAKMAQVMLCYLHTQALAEALMLAQSGGTNVHHMLEIIQQSTGASYVANQYGPKLLDRSFDPSFDLGLAHKDLAVARALATSLNLDLPITEKVEGIYADAVAAFGADAPHLIAVQMLEQANQQPLGE